MGFQDEKVVAAGDGFSDCICDGRGIIHKHKYIHDTVVDSKMCVMTNETRTCIRKG